MKVLSLAATSLLLPTVAIGVCQSVGMDVPLDDPAGLTQSIVVDTSTASGIAVDVALNSGFLGELTISLSRNDGAGSTTLLSGGSSLVGNPHACSTFPLRTQTDPLPDNGGDVTIRFDDRRTVLLNALCDSSGIPFGPGTSFSGDGDGSVGGRFQPDEPIGPVFGAGVENDTWYLTIVHSQLGEALAQGQSQLGFWCVEPYETSSGAFENDETPASAQTGPARPRINPFQLSFELPIQDTAQFRQIETASDFDWIQLPTGFAICENFRTDPEPSGKAPERWIAVAPGSPGGVKIELIENSEFLLPEPLARQILFAGCGHPNAVAIEDPTPFLRVSACDPAQSFPIEYEISEGPMCLGDQDEPGPLSKISGNVRSMLSAPLAFSMIHSDDNRLTFSNSGGDYVLGVPMLQVGVIQASAPGYQTSPPIPYGPIPAGTTVINIELQQQPIIGNATLQFPSQIVLPGGADSPLIYGQVFVAGHTDQANEPAPGILGQVGFGDATRDPGSCQWLWFDMAPNPAFDFSSNNDEYVGTIVAQNVGTYAYAVRWSTDGGLSWSVGDLDGLPFDVSSAGNLIVNSNGETPYLDGFEAGTCRAFLEIAN